MSLSSVTKMYVWKEMKITREVFENGTAVSDADPPELF